MCVCVLYRYYVVCCVVCVFKQKTAYEMRISDWSSDVCSSDLRTSLDGEPLRMIGTHTDISARKQSEAQIFRLAHYDTLTGLPNRVLFVDRFEQDRTSVVSGRRGSVSVDLCGRRIIKHKT